MLGWYEVGPCGEGLFRFVLKAGTGEVILTSQTYKYSNAAIKGIGAVQRNGVIDARYARCITNDGGHYFNLCAKNNQIVGTSQMYASQSARDQGIDAVRTNVTSTTIKRMPTA